MRVRRCLVAGERWHAKTGGSVVIRTVLVDALALVRSGIRMLLVSDGDFDVLGEGGSGEDAIRMARELRPDILLIDAQITGAPAAVKAVKEATPGCDIVVLVNRLIQAEAMEMFAQGVSGYVCKDIPGHVLLAALRAIRTPGAPRPIVASHDRAPVYVHVLPRTASPATLNALTKRERDILAELTTGNTDMEIAGRLQVSEGTVKTHIRNILRKLGVPNRTAAIAYALREGLID
jgi:DNA-binding NarL/FixJ family response regulator